VSNYYRAACLDVLVRDLNVRWPKRDHRSDGWIGDASHQARKSDHNPDWKSIPPGIVRAEDIDINGIHVPTTLAALFIHASTRYVIFQKKIWHRDRKFRPAVYKGTPHVEHIHDSAQPGKERTGGRFALIATTPNWGAGIHNGAPRSRNVVECQAYLNAYGAALAIDGDPGPKTLAAIGGFQRKHGLKSDNWAGPKTLAEMRVA
jgi:hypothetical protein